MCTSMFGKVSFKSSTTSLVSLRFRVAPTSGRGRPTGIGSDPSGKKMGHDRHDRLKQLI